MRLPGPYRAGSGRAHMLTGRAWPKIVEGKTGRAENLSGRAVEFRPVQTSICDPQGST